MAQLPRHVITLKGSPEQAEDGAAGAAITPGMLVSGVSTVHPYGSAGGSAPLRFALERQEMGAGIDVAYAIGDTVKVGSFAPGDRIYALVPSGQTIAEGERVEAATGGTLRAYASGKPLGIAMEACTAVTPGNTRLRVELM